MKSPVTVAIVDDDAFVRSALVSYVSATPGFQLVHQCTNGAEAVEVIVAEPVDVVITDVRMPKLDGIGATAALRAALGVTTSVRRVLVGPSNVRAATRGMPFDAMALLSTWRSRSASNPGSTSCSHGCVGT